MAIIKKLYLALSLLVINLFSVIAYADIADIPTVEPTNMTGLAVIVMAVVAGAIALLSVFKKKN